MLNSVKRKRGSEVFWRMLIILMISIMSSNCKGFTRRLNPPTTPTTPANPTSMETPPFEKPASQSKPPTLNSVPNPTLFDTAWLDRTIFVGGLIPSARSVLDERYDRSVYHLAVDIADDLLSLSLKEELLYTNHEATALDEVILRMYPPLFGAKVNYTEFKINGQLSHPQVLYQDTVLLFALDERLDIGESVVISINLTMQMPEDPSGNYQIFGHVKDLLTLAHFYPMAAVYDGDGWHTEIPTTFGDVTYSDTSYYLVKVTLPLNAAIVSSGNSLEPVLMNDHQVITIAGGPMRDFYLAAGTNLEVYSDQLGSTMINSYAPAAIYEGNMAALDIASTAIELFDREIGPYPYTEFDVLATYTTALGVEYPGVTAINQNLYQGEQGNQTYLEATVAHEVGHQWFYGVVGNDQVNQPWLDESLTQYITGIYFLERYGAQVSKDYQSSWYSRWDRVQREQIPIGLPVKYYEPGSYSAIVYGRGPVFFSTLEKEISETTFKTFLQNYYTDNLWENTSPIQMKEIAEDACACDLTSIFDEWVNP